MNEVIKMKEIFEGHSLVFVDGGNVEKESVTGESCVPWDLICSLETPASSCSSPGGAVCSLWNGLGCKHELFISCQGYFCFSHPSATVGPLPSCAGACQEKGAQVVEPSKPH